MQSILVTGGAGFIGHHLVRRLLQQDYRVVIIDNLSSAKTENIPRHQNAVFYKEDVRNMETISDIVKRERIDACIHLAAITSVTESLVFSNEVTDVNVNGTASVLEACTNAGVGSFVFASSAAVYGEAKILPVPEDKELRPISPYGESKVAGEKLVESYQKSGKIPHAISLRFFNVYGEGQNPRYAGVITKFTERLSKGLPPVIYGDGMQTRDFISINDVVDAIMLAIGSGTFGVFNIGTGKAITINELAKEMMRMFGLDLRPEHQKANHGEILHSCADIKRSSTALGFVARRTLEVELRNIIETNLYQQIYKI
ncbi:NAD-dependent epimerase/dehydratase family, includes UDP-galactose 4-epimerase-like proteins [Candidatus Nitrososphaera gargensis Ga9.2]|uniref:NAD-dependent epimerase/dehydratase family, includes UDP-galactose 4-epimerase-like proteins n=1 Tax=Nitrososphaera gargensis (strain Ga9.2) TaxID=1237085 RepID=K0IGD0_NITGG|nr:SDR family NAD(P)-dependent oxidoreductase [Candidatus Nitrososphaera gargensis]AFU57883.1 NAD-dependent epimerase/dehydratase family, includes UDP-galactose 4-epimerase-like proteins [Candidatus Nitrososphaera gargensis Ga9.2]